MDAIRKDAEGNQFSSSPAFGTPVHPILPGAQRPAPPQPAFKPAATTTNLPIRLPPATLRPLAFRTFTKKHNLTLTGPALQALANFIGKHCGSGWREEGTGEKVLDEVAKLWKAESGPAIVEDSPKMKGILKTLEGSMVGGRIGPAKSGSSLSRQSSFAFGNDSAVDLDASSDQRPSLSHHSSSFGLSSLHVDEPEDEHEDSAKDPRAWTKVTSAFALPRITYDMDKKHFVPSPSKPSLFPSPADKTALARDRYNTIHQRLLRNPAFQAPSFSARAPASHTSTTQQFYKITPIANLLGRGGSQHLLLGMLLIAPTGTLALNDPSGSITLDLQHATPMQGPDSAFFTPGMILLVEGQYEEDWSGAGSSGLGNTGGVGGMIGGRLLGFNIGGPPVERRNVSLGIDLKVGDLGGGFGWTDFTGLGSERAVGARMRKLENRLLGPDAATSEARRKVVILGEVTLDVPSTLLALRKVLGLYAAEPDAPMTFILTGNFSSRASMANAGTGSIEYKELFDSLAALLSDFPTLLRSSTWVFVPGDNDPWASSFSAGASALVPREGVPELFTSRIRRAFANAITEGGATANQKADGEAVWTSNPTRLNFFGPAHEVVVFRDDVSARMRRNAVRVGATSAQRRDTPLQEEATHDDTTMAGALDASALPSTETPASAPTEPYATLQAKKVILSLLPQSTLSPFPAAVRPTHWSYSSALSLYPLPHTIVLVDAEAEPYALTYEGCHVVNPGKFVREGGRRSGVRWGEYCCWGRRGVVREDSV